MKLYHGTSSKNLDSIMKSGLRRSPNDVWPEEPSVCALDSLEKAREVAAYFGKDGIVIEIDVPESELEFHPD